MKKALIISMIIIAQALAYGTGTYVLSMHYENSTITLSNVSFNKNTFAPGQISPPEENIYYYELWSHNGTLLDTAVFEVPNKILTDGFITIQNESGNYTIMTGDFIILNKTDFTIITDYYYEGAEIKVFSELGKTITAGVSQYSQCNQDKECNGAESMINCASDCQSQLIKKESTAETQEEKQKTEQKMGASAEINTVFTIAVITMILLTIMITLKRKSGKTKWKTQR